MKNGLIECVDAREWWVSDRRHHAGGPAIEKVNGTREWWIDGERIREEKP